MALGFRRAVETPKVESAVAGYVARASTRSSSATIPKVGLRRSEQHLVWAHGFDSSRSHPSDGYLYTKEPETRSAARNG